MELSYRGFPDKSFFIILFRRLALKCQFNADRVSRNSSVGHLPFIEEALQLRWRSARYRAIRWHELKNLQRGITTPLEVS